MSITIYTSDSTSFTIPAEIASKMKYLDNYVKEGSVIKNIDPYILKLVIAFMRQEKIKVKEEDVVKLANASDKLGIGALADWCCNKLVKYIKNT